MYGHATFTLAIDTGDLNALHGLPPNDSMYVGRVVVYVLVVWAMATLDLLVYRAQRSLWLWCGVGENVQRDRRACTRPPCCGMATPRRRGVTAHDNWNGDIARSKTSAMQCAQLLRTARARLARSGPIAHATQSPTQCDCASMSDWNTIHIYRCRFHAQLRCLLDIGARNELLVPTGRAGCDRPNTSHEWG